MPKREPPSWETVLKRNTVERLKHELFPTELTGQWQRLVDTPYEKLAEEFTAAATTQFGSGWAWLVLEKGKLAVTKTPNADLPMKHGQKALLTMDVWEHAYYIDYRNARPKYIETFLASLANWDFALQNLKG